MNSLNGPAGDCAACHTAPKGQPFAGGQPFPIPIGKVFSTNITPDRETGIGEWTAHMYLLFGLRRRDILATGDLGIRAAVKKAYRMRTLPSPARVTRVAAKWHPYCSAACWYLWRSLEDAPGL